jgi:hypothetical protein
LGLFPTASEVNRSKQKRFEFGLHFVSRPTGRSVFQTPKVYGAMISETEIKSMILNILSENNAISLATTGGEYSPWILGAYFASDNLTIYPLLEKSGKTLANVKQNPEGALMISQNDAMKDFLQAQLDATLLPDSDGVRQMLVAKMPLYQTYTPCAPVRLDVSKWFASSLVRQWFPEKVFRPQSISNYSCGLNWQCWTVFSFNGL